MISILIPTYNYNITVLVEELHAQGTQLQIPFEIIVVDDASTDQTILTANNKITRLNNCTYIQSPENKGRTYTRNFLAEKARYPYLLFLDADVLPLRKTFLADFNISELYADVVFGGVEYVPHPPEKDRILRWKYGKNREARSVEQRKMFPFLSIISGCTLIRKEVFLKVNSFLENRYGLDIIFTHNLEQERAAVKHIDNPVIHYGLEENGVFIAKTEKAVESIAFFEKNKMIPVGFRPIQKAYLKLKRTNLSGIFTALFGKFEPVILKNLHSENPSLFLFDLYKLNHFIKIQKKGLS